MRVLLVVLAISMAVLFWCVASRRALDNFRTPSAPAAAFLLGLIFGVFRSLVVMGLIGLGLGFLTGCYRDAQCERPECSPHALAAIEAEYINEALTACAGQSYDDCPHLPAIRERYRARRRAWVDCR